MNNNRKIFLMICCLFISTAFGQAEIEAAKEAAKASLELAKASNIAKGLAAVGAGLAAIGAGIGIGNIFGRAAEAVARQPEATNDIRGTVNLPLFLVEGVAIIALVVCILAVVI